MQRSLCLASHHARISGIEGTEVMEEDVEDILDDDEEGVHTDLIEAKETRVTEEYERGSGSGSERGGSCIHDRRSFETVKEKGGVKKK